MADADIRKTLQTLVALEDHMLRDIGVPRSELDRLMKMPLSVDPLWELERRKCVTSSRRSVSPSIP